MATRARSRMVALGIAALIAGAAAPALAWAPYTHVVTANQAAGSVERPAGQAPCVRFLVTGVCYPIPDAVADALDGEAEMFRGGVIGPDGFPDLVMGQTVIHPLDKTKLVGTGRWLQHLLERARAANDPQALAFAYGYLSHASGDMWGHSFVNDFAQGVFPPILETLKDLGDPSTFGEGVENVANGLRHVITEEYVRDATPGWDGDPAAAPARYPVCTGSDTPDDNGCCPASNLFCHKSDNSTEPLEIDAPTGFIFNSLIDRHSAHATPSDERGALLGFFFDLKKYLEDHRPQASIKKPLLDAISDFDNLKSVAADLKEDCIDDNDGGGAEVDGFPGAGIADFFADKAECAATAVKATVILGFDVLKAGIDLTVGVVAEGLKFLIAAYVDHWIDDIQDGIEHWGELGKVISESLFDPMTRREWQFEACRKFDTGEIPLPPNQQLALDRCFRQFGFLDTLLANDDYRDFRDKHLLSMLGVPDIVGDVSKLLREIADSAFIRAVKDILETLTPFDELFRIVTWAEDEIQHFIESLIEREIKHYFHIDINIEAAKEMFHYPDAWLAIGDLGTDFARDLTGLNVNFRLFNAGDHDRVDGLLGLPADHHVPIAIPIPNFPAEAVRLKDDAEIKAGMFAAFENTITMNKLVFLDGDGLNHLFGDILKGDAIIKDRDKVRTYAGGATSNILIDALSGSPGAEPWLLSIDSDHAWRADGMPRFCNDGSAACGDADRPPALPLGKRQPILNGGNGHFPLWKSCLLRPAFRRLFIDWENQVKPFPDYGDPVLPDPSDPDAPLLQKIGVTGASFEGPVASGTVPSPATFVTSASALDLTAVDDVFTDAKVQLRGRAFALGGTPPAFTTFDVNHGSLPLTALAGTDGVLTVEVETQDPCHQFDAAAGKVSRTVILDDTPPVATITSPAAGQVFVATDKLTLAFSADDGPLGSGVASLTATLDGQAVTNGQVIDFTDAFPGTHELVVSSVDHVGNKTSVTRNFRVRPQSDSLLASLDRGFLQLLMTARLYQSLRADLAGAVSKHAKGDFTGEASRVQKFFTKLVHTVGQQCELRAVRCPDVDRAFADRLLVSAAELMATTTFTDAEYRAGLPTLSYLEEIDRAYVKTLITLVALYEGLVGDVVGAVGAEHAMKEESEESHLEAAVRRLAGARDQVCPRRELDGDCPPVDLDTGEVLTVHGAELLAGLGITTPQQQAVQAILKQLDQDFLTEQVRNGHLYDSLRGRLEEANDALARNKRSDAKKQLQEFVKTIDESLRKCQSKPSSCVFDATAAPPLETAAQSLIGMLG